MEFSMTEIKNNAFEGPYAFEGTVDVSAIADFEGTDIRSIAPVQVDGMCTVDKDQYIFSYHVQGTMILPCARTLVDVEHAFDFHATNIFSTEPVAEDEQEDIIYLTEEVLDLTPFIEENIILETPFRVFSDEKPLEGGEGWSFYTEEAHEQEEANKIDPRLAKLQTLFNRDKDEE